MRGSLASVVLPYFWMQGVKLLGLNRCSMFMNLLPVVTAAIAVGWFEERRHVYHLLGGGAALLGVLLPQKLRRPLLAGEAFDSKRNADIVRDATQILEIQTRRCR